MIYSGCMRLLVVESGCYWCSFLSCSLEDIYNIERNNTQDLEEQAKTVIIIGIESHLVWQQGTSSGHHVCRETQWHQLSIILTQNDTLLTALIDCSWCMIVVCVCVCVCVYLPANGMIQLLWLKPLHTWATTRQQQHNDHLKVLYIPALMNNVESEVDSTRWLGLKSILT